MTKGQLLWRWLETHLILGCRLCFHFETLLLWPKNAFRNLFKVWLGKVFRCFNESYRQVSAANHHGENYTSVWKLWHFICEKHALYRFNCSMMIRIAQTWQIHKLGRFRVKTLMLRCFSVLLPQERLTVYKYKRVGNYCCKIGEALISKYSLPSEGMAFS